MEGFSTEIMMTIVTAIIGGIAYVGKRYFDKKDEEQKKRELAQAEAQRLIMEARDRDKQEMKNDISDLKEEIKLLNRHLNKVVSIILKCKNPDCKAKPELAEYLNQE